MFVRLFLAVLTFVCLASASDPHANTATAHDNKTKDNSTHSAHTDDWCVKKTHGVSHRRSGAAAACPWYRYENEYVFLECMILLCLIPLAVLFEFLEEQLEEHVTPRQSADHHQWQSKPIIPEFGESMHMHAR